MENDETIQKKKYTFEDFFRDYEEGKFCSAIESSLEDKESNSDFKELEN